MKIRLADYVVQKLLEAGINTTFSVVGGGAMNLMMLLVMLLE